MMKILIIINDAPYGSEKAYNAMRLGMTLQREQRGVEIQMFLMGDAVTCALTNQSTPKGYYNIESMLITIINKGGQVMLCGTCSEARGIKEMSLLNRIEMSTMSQLAKLTVEANKVITF